MLLISLCVFSAVTLSGLTAAQFVTTEENMNATGFGPYLEVYPPIPGGAPFDADEQFSCKPSENKTCPLYISLAMSFGKEYFNSGVVPAIQYALDQINAKASLLPGYSLHYTLTDSRVSPIDINCQCVVYKPCTIL